MIIMSNNLWNMDNNSPAWAAKGEDCSAEARVDGLVEAYASVMPDILGFQEMSRHMEMLIMRRMNRMALPDGTTAHYELITGGFTPILFRHDKYVLIESGHCLFPEYFPPAKCLVNDAESKGFTFGVFEDRATKKRIMIMTTHLWWMSNDPASKDYRAGSAVARAYQINLAEREMEPRMNRYACPGVLMGDFNDKLGSPALSEILRKGWQEAHDLCIGERNEARGHHFCFPAGWRHEEPGRYEEAIDHILIKNAGKAEVKRFCRYMEPSFDRLSDHYPVYIELDL